MTGLRVFAKEYASWLDLFGDNPNFPKDAYFWQRYNDLLADRNQEIRNEFIGVLTDQFLNLNTVPYGVIRKKGDKLVWLQLGVGNGAEPHVVGPTSQATLERTKWQIKGEILYFILGECDGVQMLLDSKENRMYRIDFGALMHVDRGETAKSYIKKEFKIEDYLRDQTLYDSIALLSEEAISKYLTQVNEYLASIRDPQLIHQRLLILQEVIREYQNSN